jgi:phage anti-repressor protein
LYSFHLLITCIVCNWTVAGFIESKSFLYISRYPFRAEHKTENKNTFHISMDPSSHFPISDKQNKANEFQILFIHFGRLITYKFDSFSVGNQKSKNL